jgi:competence protein ComFC
LVSQPISDLDQAASATRRGGLAALWAAAIAGLFPTRCVGCGVRGAAFCPACWDALPRLQPPLCPRCSRPEPSGRRCHFCQHADPALTAVRAACAFADAARTAIHRLKYEQERHLAEPLAQLLLQSLHTAPLAVDALVPVPLDAARARARGYNQSALLARPVAEALGVSLAAGWLRRARATRPQVGLGARERRENVRGAFACPTPAAVAGQRILLVDDVMTTGATLESCAEALVAAGASRVFGLVVARDLPNFPESPPR